ncbi:MAG: Holliday junction branch migration protein RuvA [Butyricicoccaceae bacterium]
MFYYVQGKVAHLEPNLAVIDCQGVGYACHTSQNTCTALKLGDTARLYTYLHVREEIFDLYGFLEQEELNCFRMLIGVSGVGPKAALAILSSAPPSQLALSIITGDEKLLTRAPGIGKKIAQRIVLELKDKLAKEQKNAGGAAALASLPAAAVSESAVSEAISALMVLGYTQAEATGAMQGMELADCSAEDIIRMCLKKLATQ